MALSIQTEAAGHRRELRPTAALRQAWYWYLSLAFLPFLTFLAVVITLNYHDGALRKVLSDWRNTAFIVPIVFLFVMGPISFLVRSRLFRSYWRGEPVTPRNYLLGMLAVWTTFEIASRLLSLLGCFVSNSLRPACCSTTFLASIHVLCQPLAQRAGHGSAHRKR